MRRNGLGALALLPVLALAIPASARAGDDEVVVVEDDDDDHVVVIEDDGEDEVIEITEYRRHHHGRHWGGIHFGTVLTPYKIDPGVRPTRRVTSNQARACLDPLGERYCGNVRGFDMRFNFFHAGGSTDYPRWQGYFRTGYTTGRIDFEPSDLAAGYAQGEARSLSYLTVPLFLGGNVYLFKRSPVRPYGGLGFGFDVLKVQYAREQERPRVDASARIGFELHAGVEARITNWVALNAEVMQLWSARRRISGVPDFSNEGLTFMVGVSVNFPTWGGHSHVEKVRRVKRVKRVEKPVRIEVRDVPEEEERNPMQKAAEPAPVAAPPEPTPAPAAAPTPAAAPPPAAAPQPAGATPPAAPPPAAAPTG